MNADEIFEARAGGFFPGLVTGKFYETWDFYTELLGFHTLSEDDDRVLLGHRSGARLAILRQETDDRFSELVSATDGRGLWLNLEVEDVETECQRLSEAGVQLLRSMEMSSRGQPAFVVRDPNGVLIYIATAVSESCSVLKEEEYPVQQESC